MKLVYNISDKPPFGSVIVFAIQQLLAIMAATLVVPIIIGHSMSPAAALLGAGVGTLIYVLFTKGRSPVFLGSSFAFLGSMAAAFAGGISMSLGYLGLIIGAVSAGLVYVIIALIVRFAGVKWIAKLMPAVVIGPTVAIIGLSLAGNAIGDLTSPEYVKFLDESDYTIVETAYIDEDGESVGADSYYVINEDGEAIDSISVSKNEDESFTLTEKPGSMYIALLCGLVTLAVTMLASTFGKKMIKLIPFILGIGAGYLCAAIFTVIGMATGNDSLRIIDFSYFTNLLVDGKVALSTFVSVPDFTFLTAVKGFDEISFSYVAKIIVAYVPVAFVVFAEHIADHKNISSIIEKDLLEDPGLHRTLLGDGVGSMVGAIFGGCPNTTYGESVACVAITGNASVVTIITAAVGAIIISFLSPFVAVVDSIPPCVMGGVCMALYGFIAVSGLKMIQKIDLEKNSNLFVVSVILIAGIGGLTVSFGAVSITNIACALILGILTNLLLGKKKKN